MMIRASAGIVLAAFLLVPVLLPSGGLARTEERFVWTEKASKGFISLIYGPLDASKQPLLLLSCFNEMDVAVLNVFGVIEGTRPGEKLTIEISAGSSHPIEAQAELDDKTGVMFAEASGIEVGPVLNVLMAPGPLTIKMAATSLTLSDAGRSDAAEKFGKDCELD
jgi:hypothetical protein